MKLIRVLCIAGFALLGATWARASSFPADFTVNLNDCASTDPLCLNNQTNGVGGWLNNGQPLTLNTQLFTSPVTGTGFQTGSITCTNEEDDEWGNGWNWGGSWSEWNWNHHHHHDSSNVCGDDPSLTILKGGHSAAFPSSIVADSQGGGFFDYFNPTGQPVYGIEFIVPNFPPGTFVCDGGSNLPSSLVSLLEFDNCGFSTDSKGELLVLFWDNPGDFVPPVPEPSLGIVLFIAFSAATVVHRIRSRKASA